MTQETSDEIRTYLLEMGVPRQVVDHAVRNDIHRSTGAEISFLVVPFFIVAALVAAAIYYPIGKLHDWYMNSTALFYDALLYYTGFGFSFVLILLAGCILSIAITGMVIARSPRPRTASFVFTIFDGRKSSVLRWWARRAIERQAGEADPEQYVMQTVRFWARDLAIAALIMTGITALILPLDFRTYSVFTRDAYIRSPFLPWGSRGPHDWTSAVSVATGCSHTSGKSRTRDQIVYEVTFAGGAKVDVGRSTAVGMPWLDAMEIIDRKIKDAGAQFGARTWLIDDTYERSCIRAMRERFSPADFARAMRLIRYGG